MTSEDTLVRVLDALAKVQLALIEKVSEVEASQAVTKTAEKLLVVNSPREARDASTPGIRTGITLHMGVTASLERGDVVGWGASAHREADGTWLVEREQSVTTTHDDSTRVLPDVICENAESLAERLPDLVQEILALPSPL
jgi:hypothetical protein